MLAPKEKGFSEKCRDIFEKAKLDDSIKSDITDEIAWNALNHNDRRIVLERIMSSEDARQYAANDYGFVSGLISRAYGGDALNSIVRLIQNPGLFKSEKNKSYEDAKRIWAGKTTAERKKLIGIAAGMGDIFDVNEKEYAIANISDLDAVKMATDEFFFSDLARQLGHDDGRFANMEQ